MKSEESRSDSAPQDVTEKKPWKPLRVKVLDVPRNTETGATPVADPVEDFIGYSNS